MHNFVQNQFLNTFSEYGRKRDSTYLVLDQSNLSAEDKEKEKLAAAKNLALIGSKKRMKIVSENLDSEVSLNNFSSFQYEGRIPGEEVLALYNSLSIPLKNSFYGLHVQKSILTEIKSRKSIPTQPYTLGMKMPDFSLENHKGNLINARDEYKKYTLIDFWATWCGPCRVETPNLIAAHKKFKDHGFSVITVSIDEKNKYKTWLAAIDSDQMGLFTNLLYDTTKSTIVKELQINAIPANYLVDSTGTIVAVNLRGEELVKTVNKLLK